MVVSGIRDPCGFLPLGAMELIILIRIPLGLLVRSRTAAYMAYVAIHAFVFVFQTASLGSFLDFNDEDLWGAVSSTS